MVTVQSAENALKAVYLGAITELLNTKVNPLFTKIEQTSSDVWGKEIRKAVSAGLNGGVGAGTEDGELPTAHGKKYLQMVATLKNIYGQIQISDKAIRASADGRGAFTDLLNAELTSLLEASKFNMGRMLYGDGSGILSGVDPGTPSEGYPVGRPRFFVAGMVVDLLNFNNQLVSTGHRIRHVDQVQGRIFFENDPPTLTTIGGSLVVQGSFGKEITGLEAIFNNEEIYGLRKEDHGFLQSHIGIANAPIDDILIQRNIDAIEHNTSGTINFLGASPDVKYAYQEYLGQYKRNIDIMELTGGFKTLSFNGIPFVFERFVEDGRLILLDTTAFKLHQLDDWRFLETENGKILRQNQGRATYSATLVKYCELICDKPNGQGVIIQIHT
ncbi:MAG: phage major capsid protein [Firmicutes bacterium]|nr:phage major capsid protein [Bacillota bacterium]